jgi:hypothetical protein
VKETFNNKLRRKYGTRPGDVCGTGAGHHFVARFSRQRRASSETRQVPGTGVKRRYGLTFETVDIT